MTNESILVRIELPGSSRIGQQKKAISTRLPILPAVGDHIVWPDPEKDEEVTVVVKRLKWYIDKDELGQPVEEPYVYITVGPHKNIRIENDAPPEGGIPLAREGEINPNARALRRKRA